MPQSFLLWSEKRGKPGWLGTQTQESLSKREILLRFLFGGSIQTQTWKMPFWVMIVHGSMWRIRFLALQGAGKAIEARGRWQTKFPLSVSQQDPQGICMWDFQWCDQRRRNSTDLQCSCHFKNQDCWKIFCLATGVALSKHRRDEKYQLHLARKLCFAEFRRHNASASASPCILSPWTS